MYDAFMSNTPATATAAPRFVFEETPTVTDRTSSVEVRAGHTSVTTHAPHDLDRPGHVQMSVHKANLHSVRSRVNEQGTPIVGITVRDDAGIFSDMVFFGVTKAELVAALLAS